MCWCHSLLSSKAVDVCKCSVGRMFKLHFAIRWDMQRSRALKEHQDLLQKYMMKSGGGGGGQVKEKKKERLTTFAPKLEQCQFFIIFMGVCFFNFNIYF